MIKRNNLSASVLARPDGLIACGFGTGLAPYAPGTFGTLVGIPIFWLIAGMPSLYYAAICLILFVLGVWVCDSTARHLGVHDHSGIVWDEVVGYLITMFMVPTGWVWIVLGFVLFRLFDIVKPWPIRLLDQRVGGGFGIMVDDVLAGIYACLCLHALMYFQIIPVS